MKVIYRLTKCAQRLKVDHILFFCSCCRKENILSPLFTFEKLSFRYLFYTVFTWIDPYENIVGVSRARSFFLPLTDPLCVFFHSLTRCTRPNQLPHFSSQSLQTQLWKWPFSHLRGTDAVTFLHFGRQPFRVTKNRLGYFTAKYGGTAWTGHWFEQD